MKKILASMIIIIELLCFCNTTIAMAMNDTDSVEVQQEVAENSTKVESIKESTEEKKQEENKTMEIPKSENTEENVTSQEIAVPEKKDVEEDKLIEVEETSKEIMSETEVVQEELEKEKLEENIIDDEAIINSEDTPEIPDKVVRVTFTYNNISYSVDLSSKELGVDLNGYEYYFVTKTNTGLNLYYSNERIRASYKYPSEDKYDIRCCKNTISVKINTTTGELEKSILNLQESYSVIYKKNIVVSNQNIYHTTSNTKIFDKNCGYEYDVSKEKGENCNEVVKATKTINIYEKAGINHDIIATIQEGLTIKRIKKSVNEMHGHVWDKIELSDGQEAYVFSDEVELITDTKEINFKYNDKKYTIYLSSSSLNMNLDEYEYYFVTKTNTGLNLYYSNERIKASYKYPSDEKYDINGGINTIILKINNNGTLEKSIFDLKNKYKVIIGNNIVVSNQNIYHNNDILFKKNYGYEYDDTKEKGEICNDVVKAIKTITVYEKAGVNYDIIATVQEGLTIKRIKKAVNEIHGHVWDKIELSDGQEAYVFSDEIEPISDAKEISFKYEDKVYKTYLSPSSLNINLDNYEYYFVTKTNTGLNLYYSNERIRASYKYPSEEKYDINGGINTIIITINSNGTLSKSTFDFKNKYKVILRNNIVASNQNIYHTTSNTKIFDKSCGYEYDTAKEKEENCNETVKTIKTINIYEKAGINHDIIATVQEGIAIKRIKKSVNEIHGHVWDKIELSDGQEAYVFSDEVELITDTKEINFKYNDKKYTIYLSSSSLNMNLDNYEYYFVTKTNTGLNLYYSNERIRASYKYPSEEKYDINGGINTIIITINSNGTLSKSTFDFKNKYKVILRNNIVASNQKIYYNNSVINNVSIYDQVEKIYYQENYLWNQISQSYNTSKEIDNKERLYDSMTRLEKVEMLDDLTVWWNTAWASAMYFKDALPHASSALLYFLTKGESGKTSNTYQYENELFREGHTMRELQIDKYCVKDQLNKTINSVLTAAESINGVKDEDYITFCNVEEASGEVLPGTALDWYLTVHNYRIKTENCFFRINDFYKLNLKFGLIDYYDWEKGDPEYSDSVEEMAKEALGIVASQMFELHRAGMARNYTNYAEVNYIIRWNKGQRMGAEGMSPSVVYIGGESVDE